MSESFQDVINRLNRIETEKNQLSDADIQYVTRLICSILINTRKRLVNFVGADAAEVLMDKLVE